MANHAAGAIYPQDSSLPQRGNADSVIFIRSDDESEDEEAKKVKEANLAAYKKKKEGKTKPAAKSMVTMDVKPWGMFIIKLKPSLTPARILC